VIARYNDGLLGFALAVGLLVALLVGGCGSSSSPDERAVKDTVHGFLAAGNTERACRYVTFEGMPSPPKAAEGTSSSGGFCLIFYMFPKHASEKEKAELKKAAKLKPNELKELKVTVEDVAGSRATAKAGPFDFKLRKIRGKWLIDLTQPEPAIAKRLSSWSSAATSYNAILQGCRQPYPTNGYVAACTREWRHNYDVVSARLLKALREERPSSRSCKRATARARALVVETTGALKSAFEGYGALLDNRSYHGSHIEGPTVYSLLRGADRRTTRNTQLADRLATTLRTTCSSG
jgi:hypothetical protein